jgi:hypothetical protein
MLVWGRATRVGMGELVWGRANSCGDGRTRPSAEQSSAGLRPTYPLQTLFNSSPISIQHLLPFYV